MLGLFRMSDISQKEVLRDSYREFSKDTTLPVGPQGEKILESGPSIVRVWTAENDNRRFLRERWEDKSTGDPLMDYTFDVDSAEQVPTSYDFPPRRK